MARRSLLSEAEHDLLFGVPVDRDALARLYTFDRQDLEFIAAHRGDANRLGFAVQLALLRHPGFGLSTAMGVEPALVAYAAAQLEIDPMVFTSYADRAPTASDHARELERALGLRPSVKADLPLMIEAAALAAWPTDKGLPIAVGVIAALRNSGIVVPAPDTVERVGLAGRARARKRATEALLGGMPDELTAKLDALLVVDPTTGRAPLTWLKDLPSAPKADHVRELLDKLHAVRALELDARATQRIHSDRLALLVREGRITPAYAVERYAPLRRRAIVVATLLDLEQRLTDAALSMADRLIGASFTRGKNAREKSYTATSRDVGRLMRLLDGTAGAVEAAMEEKGDVLAAINAAVGLDELFGARSEAAAIADLAEEDPLIRAADRWATLRKYGPMLLDAVDFKAGRADDRTIAAVNALRDLNRSGKREVPEGTHGARLVITEHYSDTGGSSDHVHFLCDAFGIRFCPRLRDFPDRRLASVEPPSHYPALKGMMGKRIKVELIREHWNDIVRLVASLKAGIVAPSAMLKKLAAYERQNQLDLALQEAGRLVRTEFMVDWMESPELRRRCHAGLNKSEQRHFLASALCTHKQGRIADRSQEAQEYRASGLNLVIAAIVYWNSTYMADAVAHLRRSGDPAPDHLLAHTSPVEWEHIGFSGDFLWDRAAKLPSGRRPLNLSTMRLAA